MPKVLLNPNNVGKIDVEIKSENQSKKLQHEMFDIINDIMKGRNFGLGIHNTLKDETVVKEMVETGLKINENESVLSTVSSFGTKTDVESNHLKQSILNYSWKKDDLSGYNIVVLVPAVIKNSLGEKLYLGFPPYDTSCSGNNYRTTCNFDNVCRGVGENGNVPSEFIWGYFKNENGTIKFEENPNYYSKLSKSEKDKVFEKCSTKIVGTNKQISDAVIEKDTETLRLLSQVEQSKIKIEINKNIKERVLKGINPTLAKELSEKAVRIHQEDIATNALQYLENLLENQKQLER